VYERTGDLELANQSFEAALIPATHGDRPAFPVWLNIVTNLGNLCIRQRRWADGEAYFDVAQQLATAARDGPTKVGSLKRRGDCQHQQGKLADAAQSWNAALIIAAQLEDVVSCRTLVSRLEQHCTEGGQHAKALELQEQLAALDAPPEVPA
jgi:uncharacterized protein HemY